MIRGSGARVAKLLLSPPSPSSMLLLRRKLLQTAAKGTSNVIVQRQRFMSSAAAAIMPAAQAQVDTTSSSSTTTTTTTKPATSNTGKTERMNLFTAINNAMEIALRTDDSAVLFGEDVAFGGVFRCSQNLLSKFGPDRVFNTPLSENGIAGFAIGYAAGTMFFHVFSKYIARSTPPCSFLSYLCFRVE